MKRARAVQMPRLPVRGMKRAPLLDEIFVPSAVRWLHLQLRLPPAASNSIWCKWKMPFHIFFTSPTQKKKSESERYTWPRLMTRCVFDSTISINWQYFYFSAASSSAEGNCFAPRFFFISLDTPIRPLVWQHTLRNFRY